MRFKVQQGKRESLTHQKSLPIDVQLVYGGSTFWHFVLRAENNKKHVDWIEMHGFTVFNSTIVLLVLVI